MHAIINTINVQPKPTKIKTQQSNQITKQQRNNPNTKQQNITASKQQTQTIKNHLK